MTTPLNAHGDIVVTTTGTHGADISSQRIDDLDREALLHALRLEERSGAVAVDLGCGIGIQGLRFATLGLTSLLIDRLPVEMTILRATSLQEVLPISYLMKDVRDLRADDLPPCIAFCYSQRFLHYLRFAEALCLLRLIRSRMRQGAKLFLSASGLQSELSAEYAGRADALAHRFAPLSPQMAAKHEIHESVCLYTTDDLGFLCEQVSLRTERVFCSPFGNVKGIFSAC